MSIQERMKKIENGYRAFLVFYHSRFFEKVEDARQETQIKDKYGNWVSRKYNPHLIDVGHVCRYYKENGQPLEKYRYAVKKGYIQSYASWPK